MQHSTTINMLQELPSCSWCHIICLLSIIWFNLVGSGEYLTVLRGFFWLYTKESLGCLELNPGSLHARQMSFQLCCLFSPKILFSDTKFCGREKIFSGRNFCPYPQTYVCSFICKWELSFSINTYEKDFWLNVFSHRPSPI